MGSESFRGFGWSVKTVERKCSLMTLGVTQGFIGALDDTIISVEE